VAHSARAEIMTRLISKGGVKEETDMFKQFTITLAAAIGLGVAQASADDNLNRNFRLANRSDQTIVQVQASNIGESTFDRIDLLGDETIRPDESVVIAPFDDQGWCRFDIRITFKNGDQQEIDGVNLCTASRLTTYGYVNNGYVHSVSN
jgi:hypothetical protein